MTGRRSKTFCSILAESRLIIIGDTLRNPNRFSVVVFSWWNSFNFLSSDCIGSDNSTWIQTSVSRAWTVNDNFQPGYHGHLYQMIWFFHNVKMNPSEIHLITFLVQRGWADFENEFSEKCVAGDRASYSGCLSHNFVMQQ